MKMRITSMGGSARRRLTILLTITAITAASGGIAFAAVMPGQSTPVIIKGCVTESSGAITLLTPKHTACAAGQEAISWNNLGPVGPQGKQGVPGKSTMGFFTGGDFAATLGTAQTVASLTLPASGYLYQASVNFVNNTTSPDNVTCTLTDGAGKTVDSVVNTVSASASEAIPIVGASNAPAGTATIVCQDSANSTAAYVKGAAFTAAQTSNSPVSAGVLHTASAAGALVKVGDQLGVSFVPPECKSGSTAATVKSNPAAPGTASLSMTSMTFSNCAVSINGGPVGITLTANNLPYSLTISDVEGDAVVIGPVNLTLKVPSLGGLSCTYAATGLSGHYVNAANGVVLNPGQNLTKTSGTLCPGTFAIGGATLAPVTDTSVTGSPKVFVG